MHPPPTSGKRISIILVALAVILIATQVVAATNQALLTVLYPIDYSWRTGLTYEKEIIGQGVHQKEVYYWNTRYPFRNPEDIYAKAPDGWDLHEAWTGSNVGFKYSVIKTIPGMEASDGKLEASLSLVPYMEAKKVIQYNDESTQAESLGSGVSYTYDKYGNVKTESTYGTMIGLLDEDKTFYKDHGSLQIFNPNRLDFSDPYDDPLVLDTSYTTLHGDLSVDDTYNLDNKETTTTYWYETYPVYEEDRLHPGYVERAGNEVFPAFELMNWVSMPLTVITEDALGRKTADAEYYIQTYSGSYPSCSSDGIVPPQKEADDYLCDYHSFAGDDCAIDVDPLNEEVYGCNYGGMDDSKEPNACLRNSVTSMMTYPPLARGFEERHGSLTRGESTVYDSCGNPVGVSMGQVYMDPVMDESDWENTVSTYGNIITFKYGDTAKASPTEMTVQPANDEAFDIPSPSLTRKVKIDGYGYMVKLTAENGLTTQFSYDSYGRIQAVAVTPDALSDPTQSYTYDTYVSSELGGITALRIKEKRKLAANKYVETYYLYDGMGRHVQTQTLDTKGTADISDDEVILTWTQYDVSGRVVKEMKPIIRPRSSLTWGEFTRPDGVDVLFKQYTYDGLGRLTKTINFDRSVTSTDYTIQPVMGGSEPGTYTSQRDELGAVRTYAYDSRGNIAYVELPSVPLASSAPPAPTTTTVTKTVVKDGVMLR